MPLSPASSHPAPAHPWLGVCLGFGLLALSADVSSGQSLQNSGLELPGVFAGQTVWGDYDGDGDADLVLIGETVAADGACLRSARILRNDDGLLVEDVTQTGRLVGVYFGDAGWADYDSDGDLDLTLAGWDEDGAESLRLYLNEPGNDAGSQLLSRDTEQTDSTRADVLLGVRYADLAWGDVDRDGDLDLVVSGMDANGSSATRLYTNDRGRFHVDELNSDVLLNVHNGELAWADYDNDGDLDLALAGENVHAEGGIRRVTEFYSNEPTGALTLNAGLTSATAVSGGSLAWGDYDNDGNADLAQSGRTEAWDSVLQLYLNRPAGTLTRDPGFALNAFLRVDGDLDWIDYDNDGDLDLAASGRTILSTRRAFIFENRDGAVSAVSAESSVEGLAGGSSVWGDYDGDGRADLLLTGIGADGTRQTTLYTNSISTANRAPEAPVSLNPVTVTSRRVLFSWPAAEDLESPVLTYNLRLGSEPGAGDILSAVTPLGNGNAGYKTSYILDRALAPDTYYWSVQAVDGALAHSAFATEDQFAVGQFVSSDQSLRGMTSSAMAWGDADGDGDADLVLMGTNRSGEAQTLAYINKSGQLTLDAGARLTALTEGDVAWADYDNDGDLDLFSSGRIAEGNRANALYQVSVATDDSLVFAPVLRFRPDLDASAVAWGDVDLDGDLDLVYGGQSADVDGGVQLSYTRIWTNDGAGSFGERDDGLEGLNNGDIALGDTDGDGDLDLVQSGVSSTGVRRTDLYRNDLGAGLTRTAVGLEGLESSDLALGDYDRDGDLDLVSSGITAANDNVTNLLDNSGTGTFSAAEVSLPGIRGGDLVWADYDNDQDLDLIIAGNDGATAILQIWENTIGQAAPSALFERVIVPILSGVDFSAVAMADADGDGDLDLISSGRSLAQSPTTVVNDNLTAQQANGNVAPRPPAGLAAADSAGVVLFSWLAGSDDGNPPTPSLTYNLRMGSEPGSHDIVSGRNPLARGNAGHGLGLRINGLLSGTYFWSVQTIDAGLSGSAFAGEQTFIIDTVPPVVTNLALNRTAVGLGQTVSLALEISDAHAGVDPTVAPTVTATIDGEVLAFSALQFTGSTWNGELAITPATPSGAATISVRGAVDGKGNILAPFDAPGAFAVDAVRPSIISRSPAADETDVAAGSAATIIIDFSEALDEATVVDASFTLRQGSTLSEVRAVYDGTAQAVIVTPVAGLAPGSEYALEVSSAIADLAGNRAEDAETWIFRTRVPQLVATSPADGSTQTLVGNSRIEAGFDTAILTAALQVSGAVEISREGQRVELRDAPIFDEATGTLRFEPAEGLRPGSRYEVTLSGLLGGPLRATSGGGAYRWQFETAVPQVISVSPADLDSTVAVKDPTFVMRFDGRLDGPALAATGALRLFAEGIEEPLSPAVYDEAAGTLSVVPANGLRSGTAYRVQLAADVRGPLADEGLVWGFSTQVPRVVATDPADGATIMAGTRRLQVEFSSAVDVDQLLPRNFRLSQAGRLVSLPASEFIYDASTFTASLPPVELISGSEYRLAVLSRVGGPRAKAGDLEVSFTTAIPAVVGTLPADGDEGISTGQATLQATFSGPIARRDGAGFSLRARSLTDVQANGDEVAFQIVSVTGFGTDSSLTVVNFAAEGGLRDFTEYEATIDARVFGNLGEEEFTWRFSTAARLADAAAGGTLTNADRAVELYLPPNALTASATEIRIAPLLAASGKPASLAQSGARIGRAFSIDAGDAALRKPATLALRYTDAELGSADPARLGIFTLEGGTWRRIGGTAQPSEKVVRTTVDHFGVFALIEDLSAAVGGIGLTAVDCQPRAFTPVGGALRDATDISFELSGAADVTIRVYNAAGRLERLVASDMPMAPGRNSLSWDGRNDDRDPVASGLYIVVVSAGGAQSEKIVAVVR
ncbi:MAG: Ig-like domain-containing protein [bacterium]|nr:Ig-like domain-containing protein [bacterium]